MKQLTQNQIKTILKMNEHPKPFRYLEKTLPFTIKHIISDFKKMGLIERSEKENKGYFKPYKDISARKVCCYRLSKKGVRVKSILTQHLNIS